MIQHITDVEPFEARQLIGKVSHISASTALISLLERGVAVGPNAEDESSINVNIGRFVLINCNDFSLLGKVTQLRTSPTVVVERNGANHKHKSSTAVVEMLCSIDNEMGTVVQGLVCSPRVNDPAFIAPANLVQRLVGDKSSSATDDGDAMRIAFARLSRGQDAPLAFTPEALFGRHCAILGTTGGGKSWSVARMVEEVAKFQAKVILFDPSGEFAALERHTRHVYLGQDLNPAPHWQEVTMPYFQLTEGDLFAIFRPTGHSQGPKMRAAIQSLKLAMLAPDLAPDGTIIKAHKYKAHYESQYAKYSSQIDKTSAWFDITKLARQIENECVNPYRSPVEPGIWGDPNRADFSACMPLLNRINDIIESPNLACLFRPSGKPSLFSEIDAFLKNDSQRVLRISLQHVPFEHYAREIIANALGRYLTDLARKGKFREKPLLVVLDEAHNFLNRSLEDINYPLDSFANIAKEGRKYCLTICIATQRPRDIPEGVLSQMGTMLIHRLINDQDRSVVERACGELDSTSLQAIPSLTPGEAVLLGVEFNTPLIVKVERPVCEPSSHGPNYQKNWRL